jgi:hypothetical protein
MADYPVMRRLTRKQHETVVALRAYGVLPVGESLRGSGSGIVFQFADPVEAMNVLRQRVLFAQGPLGILHSKVLGGVVTEYRSYRQRKRRPYSLHVVIGKTGKVFADLDRFNPYQNIRHLIMHGVVEVAPFLLKVAIGRRSLCPTE